MVIALSMTAGAQTQIKEHRRSITLDEAIVIARTQSVDAAVALNELKTAYWEYRTFRANLLPEMNLKATLPSYNSNGNHSYPPWYTAKAGVLLGIPAFSLYHVNINLCHILQQINQAFVSSLQVHF